MPLQENTTPRIPEDVIAPLLKAAVFYVRTAAGDLLAAQAELAGLHAAIAGMPRLPRGRPAPGWRLSSSPARGRAAECRPGKAPARRGGSRTNP